MPTKLLFCKSKVAVHLNRNTADNIYGFLLLTKDPADHDSRIAWISERSLSQKNLDWLQKADIEFGSDLGSAKDKKSCWDLKDPSVLRNGIDSSFHFDVALNSIYSIEFNPPSSSGFWFGSIVLHLKSALSNQSLPVLYFHDDICPSTLRKEKELNKSFQPFSDGGDPYWGGIDLKISISNIVDLKRTFNHSHIWLVNASIDDLRNFNPQKAVEETIEPTALTTGGLWESWETSKWQILAQIADATAKTGAIVQSAFQRHPIVQFVHKNKDNYYVKKMLENPKVQEVQDDFDSARVYLAKWAMGVKNEAERYHATHHLDDYYKKVLISELGFSIMDDDYEVQFTDEELNTALQRNHGLTKIKWESLFDKQGRLSVTVHEIKDTIFHGGIENNELRKEVWLFLLNVYPWDSSQDERKQLDHTLEDIYNSYKKLWESNPDEYPAEFEESYWRDQVFRIEKDVKRNDRDFELYKCNTVDGLKPSEGLIDEIRHNSEEDLWTIKNPHMLTLKRILMTYNVFNPNLGYVQGMTDLLSPLYLVLRDETKTFWCFVNFMEKMERNFLRDQSGIKDQMVTLAELCDLMLPRLSRHLAECDSSNLFFCFRMILIWFKREFDLCDVCSIWEIFWTDFYSSQFQLFFMLAIMQKNHDAILDNLTSFDQILKFFNELNGKMDWNDLMTRSSLLFIRFKKIMDVLQRQSSKVSQSEVEVSTGLNLHAEQTDQNGIRRTELLPSQSHNLQQLLSTTPVIQRERERESNSVK